MSNIFKFDYDSDNKSIYNESDKELLFNKINSVNDVVLLYQPIIKNNGDNNFTISGYVINDSNKVYKTMKNYYEFKSISEHKEYDRSNYASIDSKNLIKVSY